MSRKVCFTDDDGQIGVCTKDDEDCSTCGCIPKERKKQMTDEKICPRTLGVEITEDNRVVAFGAPCIKEKCMAWIPECPRIKDYSECYGREKNDLRGNCDNFYCAGYCQLIKRGVE